MQILSIAARRGLALACQPSNQACCTYCTWPLHTSLQSNYIQSGMGGQPALGAVLRHWLRHWAARDFLCSSFARAAVHIIDADPVGYGHTSPDARLGVLLQTLRLFVDAGLKEQLVRSATLVATLRRSALACGPSQSIVNLRHAGGGGGWAAPSFQMQAKRLSA